MKPQRDSMDSTHRFTATLFTVEGKGGWTFAPLPKSLKLPITGSWGMTPVIASVDGKTWKTTVWNDTKSKSQFLPVPKKIRGGKVASDKVLVELRMDRERILGPVHPLI
jgi:hypothetical protein